MVSFSMNVVNESIESLDAMSPFEIRAPFLVSDSSPGPTMTSIAFTLYTFTYLISILQITIGPLNPSILTDILYQDNPGFCT